MPSALTMVGLFLVVLGVGGMIGSWMTKEFDCEGDIQELEKSATEAVATAQKCAAGLEECNKSLHRDVDLLQVWTDRAMKCEQNLIRLQVENQLRVKASK